MGIIAEGPRKEKSKKRIEEFKAKRHAKADMKKSKKAAKAAVAAAVIDRKKAKKEESGQPEKLTKKRDQLLRRIQRCQVQTSKLEAKTKKLTAEYKKYEAILAVAGKAKAKADDDNSSESSDSGSDSDSDTSSDDSSDDESQMSVELDPPVPADELVLKRRRESDAGSIISAKNSALSELKKEKNVKDKKADKAKVNTTTESEVTKKKEKKDKKGKGKSTLEETKEHEEDEPESKKKRKRDTEAAVANDDAADDQSTKKNKKNKNKAPKEKDDATTATTVAAAANETWNVGGLEGGAARQSKMMRLLGAGKGGASVQSAGTKVKLDSIKAEADIQRQFEIGIKAKNEGGPARRGLGA